MVESIYRFRVRAVAPVRAVALTVEKVPAAAGLLLNAAEMPGAAHLSQQIHATASYGRGVVAFVV